MLKGAIQSLENQTYKDFDVVVIDGASVDGTKEYLQNSSLNLKLVSEPDKGISDAYAKALRHASGDIVGILSSDERYYPHTIETVLGWFSRFPENIVCGGKCLFLNEREEEVDQYLDDYLDLDRHLSCEHVCSISTSFFNRRLLGKDFYYSADCLTCPDYEYWARLALKYDCTRFRWFDSGVVKAFRTQVSSSFRDDSFRQMVSDKIRYLEKFTDSLDQIPRVINTDRCKAGIHMWACEQLYFINHETSEILYHIEQAFKLDPDYPRIRTFIDQHPNIQRKSDTFRFKRSEPDLPWVSLRLLTTKNMRIHNRASISEELPLLLITGKNPWDYSLELFDQGEVEHESRIWLSLLITVCKGAVGIGRYNDVNEIYEERIYKQSKEKVQVFFETNKSGIRNMIRSGGEGRSEVIIHKAEVVREES